MIVYIPKANVLLMEKFVIFALKRTISKFAAHVLVKKYMKLKKTNLMNPPTRVIISFFIETVNIQDSSHINQIRNENSGQ